MQLSRRSHYFPPSIRSSPWEIGRTSECGEHAGVGESASEEGSDVLDDAEGGVEGEIVRARVGGSLQVRHIVAWAVLIEMRLKVRYRAMIENQSNE